jgi:hypothetical protein
MVAEELGSDLHDDKQSTRPLMPGPSEADLWFGKIEVGE